MHLPKYDFTKNWSDVKNVKFQQIRALTSQFHQFLTEHLFISEIRRPQNNSHNTTKSLLDFDKIVQDARSF